MRSAFQMLCVDLVLHWARTLKNPMRAYTNARDVVCRGLLQGPGKMCLQSGC